MGFIRYCLFALLAISSTYALELSLTTPRFRVQGYNASSIRAEALSLSKKPAPLVLGSWDILTLLFGVLAKGDGKGYQPHQTFLRFYDKVTGEEGIQPIRLGPGGRAKFELNMMRPPASLPPTTATNPLTVSLILGSFVHSPRQWELFDVYLPESQPPPQHPEEHTFHPLPEIAHTFHPEQKVPPSIIPAVFTALVVAPWVVLVGLWGYIKPTVPHLFSPHIVPFLASIAAFEALLFWYWVDLKLGQVLLYGAGLGLVTALTGRSALATKATWRLGKK